MSALVYRTVARICALLGQMLASVPVGTNLGLLHLMLALLSGRFLASRGAVFPALADLGLPTDAVRRADAALCYGKWQTADLLADWQKAVATEGRFVACEYEGVRPVPCDLIAFFRPQLRGLDGKPLDSRHYTSAAGKALPAIVFGLCAGVGQVSQISGQVSQISGQVSQISGQVSQISGQVSQISGQVSQISGQVSQISGQVSQISGQVSQISGQVSQISGQVSRTRLGLPRLLLRREAGEREADLQVRLVTQAAQTLDEGEALVVDAGFGLVSLLNISGLLDVPGLPRDFNFVARVRSNQTARRREPPAYKGRGRRPTRGLVVRPLPGMRAGHRIEATPPDTTTSWQDGKRLLRADTWDELVLTDAKSDQKTDAKSDQKTDAKSDQKTDAKSDQKTDAKSDQKTDAKSDQKTDAKSDQKTDAKSDQKTATFRLVAIHDPRYKAPLLVASNLSVSPQALWRLYRDRWAIEQIPLSAKPMLGAERAFVFGQESRYRLPELALLVGNLLSYVAATSASVTAGAVKSGFWDRAARPTCGRVRRTLARVHYSALAHVMLSHFMEFPVGAGQLHKKGGKMMRKKNSVTAHLKKGIEAHRRQASH